MSLKNKKYIVFGVVLVILTGCLGDRIPSGFPDEDEFALILADIHLSEATINQLRVSNKKIDSQSSSYYHDVLAKHNLTESMFDSITSWYIQHPQVYQEVYEKVLSNLGHEEANWQNVVKDQEALEDRKRKEKEARNIWNLAKKYNVEKKDTIDRRIPFNIGVDTIDAKAYRLSAFYRFLKGNIAENSTFEVIAMFQDSTLDTVTYSLPSTYNNTKAEITIGYDRKDTIINLSGYLLNHDTTKIIKARIQQIEFELIPRNDTTFIDEENSSSLLPKTK